MQTILETKRVCDGDWLKPRPNYRNMPTQHIATLLGATCCMHLATLLRHVGCCWPKFYHFQTGANNTQYVATHCSMVAKHTQHAAPNNVAICCAVMLQSFRRGLIVAQKVVHFNMGGVRKFDQLKVQMSNVHRVKGNVEFVRRQIH